jgi:hypothetical protein
MSYTYTGDPVNNTTDAIRLEIGDMQVNQMELADEEIQYALTREGTVYKACARCCEMLAAKYAKKDGFRGGTIQSEKTTVSGKYRTMAKLFRARGTRPGSFVIPSISQSAKDDNKQNSDAPSPSFYRGIQKNPDAQNDGSDSDMDLRITGSS